MNTVTDTCSVPSLQEAYVCGMYKNRCQGAGPSVSEFERALHMHTRSCTTPEMHTSRGNITEQAIIREEASGTQACKSTDPIHLILYPVHYKSRKAASCTYLRSGKSAHVTAHPNKSRICKLVPFNAAYKKNLLNVLE